ncbi:hypothetical protein [Tardiphaga sp.]|uniref:hypothetical protein n=1 Tax=Tardiphaga sp. TaxID=1926292 RepID=UPI0037DA64AF
MNAEARRRCVAAGLIRSQKLPKDSVMQVRSSSIATKTQVISMAVINGTTIANIYYAQPILARIAASLHVSVAQAGIIPLLSQFGFGIGLILITPLGDMIDAKRLVGTLLAALSASLLGAALSPGLISLAIASALVGACATAVQIIVPLAAATAPDECDGGGDRRSSQCTVHRRQGWSPPTCELARRGGAEGDGSSGAPTCCSHGSRYSRLRGIRGNGNCLG